jgi:hypothetical protein
MSSFKCKSHVQEITLPKKHVWLSIETRFGILWDFVAKFIKFNKLLVKYNNTFVKNEKRKVCHTSVPYKRFTYTFGIFAS